MKNHFIAALLSFALLSGGVFASDLIELEMRIVPGGADNPRVALTLDACGGDVDMRIINALIEHEIKATLFITGIWLEANPEATQILKQHAHLFDFEDHGAQHIAAVIGDEKPYGRTPAGTREAVLAELFGGAEAVKHAFGDYTSFYRGATALYTPDAIELIEESGFQVAGFSLNGDWGATASAQRAESNIANAEDGDVIIAHMNQPYRSASPGVVAGILALKAKGFEFVRLDEVEIAR